MPLGENLGRIFVRPYVIEKVRPTLQNMSWDFKKMQPRHINLEIPQELPWSFPAFVFLPSFPKASLLTSWEGAGKETFTPSIMLTWFKKLPLEITEIHLPDPPSPHPTSQPSFSPRIVTTIKPNLYFSLCWFHVTTLTELSFSRGFVP